MLNFIQKNSVFQKHAKHKIVIEKAGEKWNSNLCSNVGDKQDKQYIEFHS